MVPNNTSKTLGPIEINIMGLIIACVQKVALQENL